MISIQLEFQDNEFQELRVEGHGSQDSAQPLACNSVSVLTQTFEESTLRLVDPGAFEVVNEAGRSRIYRNTTLLESEQNEILDPLVRSYLIGIKMIRERFPEEICLELRERSPEGLEKQGERHGT